MPRDFLIFQNKLFNIFGIFVTFGLRSGDVLMAILSKTDRRHDEVQQQN